MPVKLSSKAPLIKLKTSKALKELNLQVRKLKGRSSKGMIEVMAEVMALSQKYTPVDKNVLKPSHYIMEGKLGAYPIVEVGCTAEYALYVHESPNEKVDEDGKTVPAHKNNTISKFLETALNEKKDKILSKLKDSAEIKK
jgi:hypothetical protein